MIEKKQYKNQKRYEYKYIGKTTIIIIIITTYNIVEKDEITKIFKKSEVIKSSFVVE